MTDILLTGLPRSGTTLMCHLLNKVPNAVALHEPMQPNELAGLPMDEVLARVRTFFDTERQRVLREGRATSKAYNGTVPANNLTDEDTSGKRLRVINGHQIVVSNVSRPDFRLYMKHPAFFTACLPYLASRMPCFAIVRNPLAVIMSWRSSGMAVERGQLPAAESFDPGLASTLANEPDVLRRQFHLVDFFFRRFADHLSSRVVKYEDVVATGGRALSLINPDAATLVEPLESRNDRMIGKDSEVRAIAEALLASDNACWLFYRRDEVEALLR